MTNRWHKLVRQLHQKKFRRQEGLFLVEGAKSVHEALQSDFRVAAVFYTEKYEASFGRPNKGEAFPTDADVLEKSGTMQSNDGAIAVLEAKSLSFQPLPMQGYVLALDDVRDPGNLGTIMRLADWYGISQIVCSESCADCYNPKVIAASMGSFTRVLPAYGNLNDWLRQAKDAGFPIYGAFMEGESIYEESFGQKGVVVMGNEANGIQEATLPLIDKQIAIPRVGGAESLNVAIATAIIADNIARCMASAK